MENIVFRVSPKIAVDFQKANEDIHRKAELMVNALLKDLLSTQSKEDQLKSIMQEATIEAKKNGLTEEKLKNLLEDDDKVLGS
jgi:hypothetical protein